MFGKKTIITLIVVGVGALVYFLFFSGEDSIMGGGSKFGGLGGSNNSVKYVNTRGRDGTDTTKTLSESMQGRDGANSTKLLGNNTETSTTVNVAGKDGTDGGGLNYNYTILGDTINQKNYSQNTKFNIDATEKEANDYTKKGGSQGSGGSGGESGLGKTGSPGGTGTGGGGSGSGGSSAGTISRQETNKPLTNDDLRDTDIYKACINVVQPLLNGNYTFIFIKNSLLKITGFNLLSIAQQDGFANDILNRKYGKDADKYCLDITNAIANVFGELAIYQECLTIVGGLLAKTRPEKTDIRIALLGLTGFSLLKSDLQEKFIQEIFERKYGDDPQKYCLNIVSAILDAMEGLALYKACIKIVDPLIKGTPSLTEIRNALLKLPGFTLISEQDQNKFMNDIATKKYGENADRYCVDIVSAILEAMDPAKLYQNCLIALKEVLKERELLGGNTVPEETILLKLSVMGIFNGLNTFEERKKTAKLFFGAAYDEIILDIQRLTPGTFEAQAPKICTKIVDLILDSILGDNIYAKCIQAMEEARANKLSVPLLSKILPDSQKLKADVLATLEGMFRSFLSTGNPTAEDICMFFAQTLLSGDIDPGKETPNSGNAANAISGNTKGATDDASSALDPRDALLFGDPAAESVTACTNLVKSIDRYYKTYTEYTSGDPVEEIVKQVEPFEFFIPGDKKPEIIRKTLVVYLSKPRRGDDAQMRHRDVNHIMSDSDMSYFSQLSDHEKLKISQRLFDAKKTVVASPTFGTAIPEDTLIKDVYPYICKCAHPGFEDVAWYDAFTQYTDAKINTKISQSLPSDPIQKAQLLNSSSFFQKCVNNAVTTLTSNDTTTALIRAKIEANLTELGQYGIVLNDTFFDPLQCYAVQCSGHSTCPLSCQNQVSTFCEIATTKYLAAAPQGASLDLDQIFACQNANTGDNYNLVQLHCAEVAQSYYDDPTDQSQFRIACFNGISRVLATNVDDISAITQAMIKDELSKDSGINPETGTTVSYPENAVYKRLSDAYRNNIARGIYDKIQLGQLDYNKTVEQSCYDATKSTRDAQAVHMARGMIYFVEDAESVRNSIVKILWDMNTESRLQSNRPVTAAKCLSVAKDQWDKFSDNTLLTEKAASKVTLPPSKQCKCYLDRVYSLLHELTVDSDTECDQKATEIKAVMNNIRASSDKTAASSPSIIVRDLVKIPRYTSLPAEQQATIRAAIEKDLTTNRQAASTSQLDREIFLTGAQRTKHCDNMKTILTFTDEERAACGNTLAQLNYEMASQREIKSNNVLCSLIASSMDLIAYDDGQMNVFPSGDTQYKDIRQSTCTQKLRAIYFQINAFKPVFWESDEDWTFDRKDNPAKWPKCENVSDDYGNINLNY